MGHNCRDGSVWGPAEFIHNSSGQEFASLRHDFLPVLQAVACHFGEAFGFSLRLHSLPVGLHILAQSFNRLVQDGQLASISVFVASQIYEQEQKSPCCLLKLLPGPGRELMIIFSNRSKAVWLSRTTGRSWMGPKGRGRRVGVASRTYVIIQKFGINMFNNIDPDYLHTHL